MRSKTILKFWGFFFKISHQTYSLATVGHIKVGLHHHRIHCIKVKAWSDCYAPFQAKQAFLGPALAQQPRGHARTDGVNFSSDVVNKQLLIALLLQVFPLPMCFLGTVSTAPKRGAKVVAVVREYRLISVAVDDTLLTLQNCLAPTV